MAEPAHTASTEHPAEGGHGGFPPFQSQTFASQLVWLAIAFVLLYVLMAKLALPRVGAQAIANETRDKQTAAADATRKTLEGELNVKLAEAEKSIAATKQAAMANVRAIAEDAARAIIERLIGSAPSDKAVAAAVADVLKN